jgi:hypothetical protein
VEARQRQRAESYLLITQPDHAQLSGELARAFVSDMFPRLSPDALDAIGAHDAGWSKFPGEASLGEPPMLTPDGKPRSFIEFAPAEFTQAWTGSIDHAVSLSPLGGLLVSRHFVSLAEFALKRLGTGTETECLHQFLDAERSREQRLRNHCQCPQRQLDEGLEALQFCDLLSLALCCAVTEQIDFPQCFSGKSVRMRFENGVYELSPSPLQPDHGKARTLEVSVPAREYPGNRPRTVSFALR